MTLETTLSYIKSLHQNQQDTFKNIDKALEINLKLANIHNSLFIESSPGPVKYAAYLLGLCSEETRLPLVPIKDNTKNIIKNNLVEAGLI